MKVYIFIVKRYFTMNGVHYACAIDNEEISLHKSFEDAAKKRVEKYNFTREYQKEFIREENHFDGFAAKIWQMRLTSGYDYVFEIIEKDLC